jgi:glyoxylase-like metal-dependent hydrolase (beta-lactamase superfamily II)
MLADPPPTPAPPLTAAGARLPEALGLRVVQRGWLSANAVLFPGGRHAGAAVVDTGQVAHAAQTLALVAHGLGGEPLRMIVNTHLHSDHCGGNAALQATHPGARTLVPEASVAAVRAWDADRLSYASTAQACPRFMADGPLVPGGTVRLGDLHWQVHAAPGHDDDAVMLFQPDAGVLIAGDVLWEQRLAIVFGALKPDGAAQAFASTARALDAVEALSPRCVIPGHGAPFDDVGAALARSRQRLEAFMASPLKHARHAARALTVFHAMEVGPQPRDTLLAWMRGAPVLHMAHAFEPAGVDAREWAARIVDGLIDDGVLAVDAADRVGTADGGR